MYYLLLGFLLVLPFNLNAAVSVVVSGNSSTGFTYTYSVANDQSFPISQWALEFDIPEADLDWDRQDLSLMGDVTVPLQDPMIFTDDWAARPGIPVTGLSAQDFFASDDLGGGDILLMETLDGFSFTSGFAPGPVIFREFGPAGQSSLGTVLGPVVPEPSVSMMLSAFFVFWLSQRRRKITR